MTPDRWLLAWAIVSGGIILRQWLLIRKLRGDKDDLYRIAKSLTEEAKGRDP